ncbi:MAG: cell division protein ZapB [Gammaproteobacteria bacterium]|nr:cell division protein ZapB [Gammaproteobacteria bacterium]
MNSLAPQRPDAYYPRLIFIAVEVMMELLDQLEQKITLALETIELLTMENEELKQEVAQLKSEKEQAQDQQQVVEQRINRLLKQFNEELNVA